VIKKNVAIREDGLSPAGDQPVAARAEIRPEGLETRVCRLEDAVASLQDTLPSEERIVERVSTRLGHTLPAGSDKASSLLQSGRRLLPAAISVLNAQADIVHQPAAAHESGTRAKWFLIEIYADARTIVRMYLDRRYRMTWAGLVVPPLLIIAIVLSYLLPGTGLPFLGTLFDKTIDLMLAFVLFKMLSREAHRYRDQISQQHLLPRA
jgi:hypothetical protein